MCSSPSFGCFRLRSGRGLRESPPWFSFEIAFALPSAFQERLGLAHALDSSVRVSRRVVGATVLRAPARSARATRARWVPGDRDQTRQSLEATARPDFPHTFDALRQGARQHARLYAGVPLLADRVLLADGQRSNLPLRLALTSDGFAFSLTLFSESFSTVLRSTCSLSVSRSVSSLGWSVPPRFGLRSQATLLSNQRLRMQSASTRAPAMGPTPALGTAPVVGSRTRFRRQTDDLRLWSIRHNSSAAAFGAAGFSAGLTFKQNHRSRFTRRYWENPSWFLFHRLVICLNSAGSPARLQVTSESLSAARRPRLEACSRARPCVAQCRMIWARAGKRRSHVRVPTYVVQWSRKWVFFRAVNSLFFDQVWFDTEADLAVTLSAVMYVRNIDDLCILQFTPTLASGRVLHRPASRVVHRRKCSFVRSCAVTVQRPPTRRGEGRSSKFTVHHIAFFSGPKPLFFVLSLSLSHVSMILPQVHLRKPCYDFYFL